MWWSSIEEKEAAEKIWKEIQANMIWGRSEPYIPRDDHNVKLAWVTIGDKRVMLGVDNQTMQGYAMNTDIPTWKYPLEPVAYDKFERWCTTFDV